jgi:hypothetical protein
MMKIAVFSTTPYDREFLARANDSEHELRFFEPRLTNETVSLATGFEAVCVFVNDRVDAAAPSFDEQSTERHSHHQKLDVDLASLEGVPNILRGEPTAGNVCDGKTDGAERQAESHAFENKAS